MVQRFLAKAWHRSPRAQGRQDDESDSRSNTQANESGSRRHTQADDCGLTMMEVTVALLVAAALVVGVIFILSRVLESAEETVAQSNLNLVVAAAQHAHIGEGSTLGADAAATLSPYVENVNLVSTITTYTATTPSEFIDLQEDEAYVKTNLYGVADSSSPRQWDAGPGDLIWVVTRANTGATYCAFVVLEIRTELDYSGPHYDAAYAESDVADCGVLAEDSAIPGSPNIEAMVEVPYNVATSDITTAAQQTYHSTIPDPR